MESNELWDTPGMTRARRAPQGSEGMSRVHVLEEVNVDPLGNSTWMGRLDSLELWKGARVVRYVLEAPVSAMEVFCVFGKWAKDVVVLLTMLLSRLMLLALMSLPICQVVVGLCPFNEGGRGVTPYAIVHDCP